MINVPKSVWSFGRKALEDEVAAFKNKIEQHKETEGIPAPFSEYEIVQYIVEQNDSFLLEDELPWVWVPNGIGNKVFARRLTIGEEVSEGEFTVNFDPTDYILEDDGVSIRLETEEEKLPAIKNRRQLYINFKRDEYIASGVQFNGWSFDSDRASIDNLTAAVAFIKSAPDANLTPPSTISWRDSDNIDRDLTVEQLIMLGAAFFQKVQEAHFKARMLKDTIEICTSLEEVAAIDW